MFDEEITTPGLSMFEGTETFDDIIGLDNIKSFLTRLFNGPNRPNSIVFIDFSSSSTNDSSGVALDQLQNILTEIQDKDAIGCLLFGKSLIAKAAGKTFGVPTLKIDFGAVAKDQIRAALKRIRAISSEKTLWLLTAEMGSFFFTGATRGDRVWKMYKRKYGMVSDLRLYVS